jgi:hypothetical protein
VFASLEQLGVCDTSGDFKALFRPNINLVVGIIPLVQSLDSAHVGIFARHASEDPASFNSYRIDAGRY